MTSGGSVDAPHLPQPAPIDAYGDGGFRFGGMSHRGSLLCFPDGIWAWPVGEPKQLNEDTLAAVFDRAQTLAPTLPRSVAIGRYDADRRGRAHLQHPFG
jgi:uncharacterized protein